MRVRPLSTSLLLLVVGAGPFSRAYADTQVHASAEIVDYADEPSATARIDLGLTIRSEETLVSDPRLTRQEVRLYSFFESGPNGDHSLDVEPAVARWDLFGDKGHLWLGKAHPLSEATAETVSSTSAIGSLWGQNQSDPLTPRVAGWVGAGYHSRSENTGVDWTLAFSPLFLPSFGPSVTYSDTDPTQGSRFARLPPTSVQLYDGGPLVPLRYEINTGDLAQILLQPQAFGSVAYENAANGRFAFSIWSAPNPSPSVNTNASLQVLNGNVNALVVATPDFVRQEMTALTWTAPKSWNVRPDVEGVYDWTASTLTASASVSAFAWVDAGVLHTWNLVAQTPAIAGLVSPLYADRLLWAQVQHKFEDLKLRPSLRVETHLISGAEDLWVRPALSYEPSKQLTVFTSLSMLSGEDASYFGTWRALDSVQAGVSYLW